MNYYMIISVVILCLSLFLFLHLFEKRKPKAREIVVLACMSALTVVSNLICAYTIPFHAGTAMVILTGIALGPQAGFFTGILSRFVCNFFMGQGVWTPWEMVAWGILGAMAGIMFGRGTLRGHLEDVRAIKKAENTQGFIAVVPVILCLVVSEIVAYLSYLLFHSEGETFCGWRIYVYGIVGITIALCVQRRKIPCNAVTVPVYTFISVFLIYGGIMNLAAFFMTGVTPGTENGSLDALKLLYVTGAPYDALHAGGAAICSFLFGDSIIQKLERIRMKYGMYQS